MPNFKIVINTNFLPKILDDTIFSSDRLILLNFNAHFDQQSRDSGLKSKFLEPDNISGIFNWCYEGYRMLDRAGKLQMPEKSKALFDKYRDESNLTKQFLEECLVAAEGARTKFKAVYEEYKEWARENGYKQCSRGTLKKDMEDLVKIEPYIGQECIFD